MGRALERALKSRATRGTPASSDIIYVCSFSVPHLMYVFIYFLIISVQILLLKGPGRTETSYFFFICHIETYYDITLRWSACNYMFTCDIQIISNYFKCAMDTLTLYFD